MEQTLAMVLAGGRGKRMDILCQVRPKPALPFAGRFRVIDFSLSNCIHSQIRGIAVLTDYQRSNMAMTLKGEAKKFLGDVPEEYVFRCCDGSIFRNMQELGDTLGKIGDDTFTCHANTDKNDFSNWVRDVIQDDKLATDLAKSPSRT